MGLVARVAEHALGMRGGDDLGEGGGFGGVLLMAPAAEVGDVWEFGFGRAGVVCGGVGVLGAVAGFAGNVGVFSGGARGSLGVVTGETRVLAGVGEGLGANGIEGSGGEVAIAAEVFRDNGGAGD